MNFAMQAENLAIAEETVNQEDKKQRKRKKTKSGSSCTGGGSRATTITIGLPTFTQVGSPFLSTIVRHVSPFL